MFRLDDVLEQDDDCPSIEDILTFSIFESILNQTQWIDLINNEINQFGVWVFSIVKLKVPLHAEQHCTNRVYDYLLPIASLLNPNTVSNLTFGFIFTEKLYL